MSGEDVEDEATVLKPAVDKADEEFAKRLIIAVSVASHATVIPAYATVAI
jgi:hypothetical protein